MPRTLKCPKIPARTKYIVISRNCTVLFGKNAWARVGKRCNFTTFPYFFVKPSLMQNFCQALRVSLCLIKKDEELMKLQRFPSHPPPFFLIFPLFLRNAFCTITMSFGGRVGKPVTSRVLGLFLSNQN